ncbi:MAG: hypothetical protein COA54_06895 [Thiotrichaceae bacterium]|nr:MAG: hypothetical protein COA54_06895 [Thiotrichaceae bacterium]
MTDNNKNIDWEQTTWEGSRKAQLRQWLKLTLRERLQAVENMGEISQHFKQMREQGRFKDTQKK